MEVLRDDFYVEAVPEMGLPEDAARRGDRLSSSRSVIISWITTLNRGCSVHASSPIAANSCFTRAGG